MTGALGTLGKGSVDKKAHPCHQWSERRHGVANHNLSQFLMEDIDNTFIGLKLTPHPIVLDLKKTLEELVVPENLMRSMLACQENLNVINPMIGPIQSKLRMEEAMRKGRLRTPRIEEKRAT